MNPTDNIKKMIKELVLPGTEAADDRIVNDAMNTFEQAGLSESTRINPHIRTWIKRAVAAVVVISILVPLSYGASRVIRTLMIKKLAIKPAWRGGMVMDFKLDKDIHFDLRVGTEEYSEIILRHNIRLFVEEGQLSGTLRSDVFSWPKFKWRTRIDLLDSTGKSIASTEQVRENSGLKHQGRRDQLDHNIHFSFGAWDDVLQRQVKKVSVKYEQVSEDTAITPSAWIESSKLEVLHGRVTDAHGEPVAYATVQIREKRKKGQNSIDAKDVFTDGQGFYSFDEIRWPYTVGVLVYAQDPSSQEFYHQYKRLNRTLDGTQEVDFVFEEFPRGTAVLAGQVVKPGGSAATEFTVDVRNKVDWKDDSGQYLHQFGIKKSFVSPDGRFEISGLAPGTSSVLIILTGKEFESAEFDLKCFQLVCELVDGKITEVATNETEVKKVEKPEKVTKAASDEGLSYYGRVLYENGKPAVPPSRPWKGARVYAILRYTEATATHGGRTERLGDVDEQGYFRACLSDEQLENIKKGKYRIEIYHPSHESEFSSGPMGTFPAGVLTQDRDTLKGYRLPFEGMSVEFKNLEQILKSYDVLDELGSVLLKWSDKHGDRFPGSLNEVVSFADSETLIWIMENVEYQAGGTEREVEVFPVAYDKTLLETINGTHVLFSNGDVKFLRRREVEIIDSY